MSRRDFLRGIAAAGAALTMPNLLSAVFTERAWAVEVKEGMTWEEGLAALKHDVFNTPNETIAFFTGGERTMWRKPRDLGKTRGTTADVDFYEQFIKKVLAEENVSEVKRAHTHTYATLVHAGYITEESREALARKEILPTLAPPSTQDILLLIWTHKRWFERENTSFEDLVLDPAGVWRMSLTNGPLSSEIFDLQLLWREEIPRALERSNLPLEDRERILACIKTFDRNCVREYNIAEISKLFERNRRYRMASDVLFAIMFRYGMLVDRLQKESPEMSDAERQNKIAEVIQIAEKFNVTLSFQPYGKKTNR